MALQAVQQNLASEIQTLASEIIAIKNRLSVVVAMYAAENMAAIVDADLQSLPEFAHVTVAELTAAKNALDAINTTIGEYVAGTNAVKLMRIVRSVPR